MRKTVSGVRGVAGIEIDAAAVMGFCGSFARVAGPECAIGMDTRPSGPALRDAAAAALMAGGTDVLDMGVAPTPAVFREARRRGAGVIVTSSHNPLEWNGLKFVLDGRGMGGAEMLRMLDEPPICGEPGTCRDEPGTYVEDAAGAIGRVEGAPKVAIDAGGGAAAGYAPRLMEAIGCDVNTIDSARGPDPTRDDLAGLCASGRPIGLAFDLDGDRLVLVINGRRQSPDVTLGLGVAAAVRAGCKRFVFSADTSIGVERYVLDRGCAVWRSSVGEANVAREMEARGAQAGGEGSSGGFIMPEFNWCRDGMLAGGMIASLYGAPEFAEALDHMSGYVQMRGAVEAPLARHGHIMGGLAPAFRSGYSDVGDGDGLRGMAGEESWVLVRPSNTEDVIRVSAEARSTKECAALLRRAKEMVKDAAS